MAVPSRFAGIPAPIQRVTVCAATPASSANSSRVSVVIYFTIKIEVVTQCLRWISACAYPWQKCHQGPATMPRSAVHRAVSAAFHAGGVHTLAGRVPRCWWPLVRPWLAPKGDGRAPYRRAECQPFPAGETVSPPRMRIRWQPAVATSAVPPRHDATLPAAIHAATSKPSGAGHAAAPGYSRDTCRQCAAGR